MENKKILEIAGVLTLLTFIFLFFILIFQLFGVIMEVKERRLELDDLLETAWRDYYSQCYSIIKIEELEGFLKEYKWSPIVITEWIKERDENGSYEVVSYNITHPCKQ